jgi:hypothetical protein
MSNTTSPTVKKMLEHFFKFKKVYLITLLLIVLISPFFFRFLEGNLTAIGSSSYFHIKAAEQISLNNFYQNPYHLLLSINSSGNLFIYHAIQLVLGLFSILLLLNIIKKFKLSIPQRFFFLFFLIISPAFIYTFTTLNHHSLFIFLVLLGFNLLINKQKFINCLSYPVFAIITFFDIFSSILTLLFLAGYFYLKKDRKVKTISGTIIFLTFFNIFLKKSFLLGPYLAQNGLLDIFSDLGSFLGLSMFAFLLVITGLIVTWKKEKFFLTYFFLSLLIILLFYQNSSLIYLNFFAAFLAAFGFTYFLNKEWKINILKNFFLFLLILGLAFSTVGSINSLIDAPPSQEVKKSLLWLKDNSFPNRAVFSHPQDSYIIEYFSQRSVLTHYHDSDFKTKEELINQIYQSTYIKDTFPLMKQNNASCIFLPPNTRENLPTDRGLIFLLQNERFKKIYDWNNIEIWRFVS